ncbi:MAG: heavy metal-associated domain-containing protein, partial [Ramlibacter sp.]
MSFASLSLDAMPSAPAAWQALDERAEWASFGRPLADGTSWESYLAIDGMHCAACTFSVEAALQGLPGVREVQVNGASGTARLVWTPGQSRPSEWLAALQHAGYAGLPACDLVA